MGEEWSGGGGVVHAERRGSAAHHPRCQIPGSQYRRLAQTHTCHKHTHTHTHTHTDSDRKRDHTTPNTSTHKVSHKTSHPHCSHTYTHTHTQIHTHTQHTPTTNTPHTQHTHTHTHTHTPTHKHTHPHTVAKGERGHPTRTRTRVYRVPNMRSERHTKEPGSMAWQPESIFNRSDDHIVTLPSPSGSRPMRFTYTDIPHAYTNHAPPIQSTPHTSASPIY